MFALRIAHFLTERSTTSARPLLTVAMLGAVALGAGCTCGTGPYEGDYFDGDRPGSMAGVKFIESKKGDPKIIGCADGQREGFAEVEKNPRVAGCVGTWEGAKSMRDPPTGKACGDDGDKCNVPADLCAPGWHVCGNKGTPADMRDRATAKDCDNAGPGRFNAAMSHSPTDEIDPCPTITKATTLPCVQAGLGSEPVCCGNDCNAGKCKDGVWKGRTKISVGTSEGCGAVTSDHNGALMCCYDGEGNPADDAKADEKAGGTGGGTAADAKATGGGADADSAGDAKADAKKDDAKKDDAKKDDAKKGDKKADAKKDDAKKTDKKADAKKDDAKKADKKADAKKDEKKAGG